MNSPTGLVVVALFAFANFACGAIIKGGIVIPTYSEPCRRNDTNFNGCIKTTLQKLLPRFRDGVKELNIPALDPFFIDEYLFNYDAGDVTGKCLFKNFYMRGLADMKILDVRSDVSDPDYFEMELDVNFPKIVSTANYKAEGQIGNFPIQGKGVGNMTAVDISGTFHLIGHSVLVDGQKHIKISDLRLKEHEVGDAKFYASNLINGNPELSQMALTFVNQFWRLLHQLMLPNIQEGFEKVFRPFVNQLFLQIPYDQLFPPSRR